MIDFWFILIQNSYGLYDNCQLFHAEVVSHNIFLYVVPKQFNMFDFFFIFNLKEKYLFLKYSLETINHKSFEHSISLSFLLK